MRRIVHVNCLFVHDVLLAAFADSYCDEIEIVHSAGVLGADAHSISAMVSYARDTGGWDFSGDAGLRDAVMDHLPHSICKARAGLMPALVFCAARWADAAFVWRRPARMRGHPAKPHPSARRAPRRGANGCADVRFLTCAVVQPFVLRPQAALGSGFSLQAAFWYQNAMLALFLRSKKSLNVDQSSFCLEEFLDFHFVQAMKFNIFALRMS